MGGLAFSSGHFLAATSVMLLTACGGEGSSAASGPSTASGSGSELANADLEFLVPPDEEGNLPPDLWVTCGTLPKFQISDLDDVVPLGEDAPDGIWEATKPFLAEGEGEFWPQDGWSILRRAEEEVVLVVREDSGGLSFMTLRRQEGAWVWWSAVSDTACPLQYVVPDGLNEVDWRLDPDALPDALPDAAATALRVVVEERDCASGQEIGDRLLGPRVVTTESGLWIAFAALRPPQAFQHCVPGPTSLVSVDLPEPLGEREIFEGLAVGKDLADYLP